MQLIYCQGQELNFGDDLNAVLWPSLLPRLLDGAGREGFLGIGTLVGRPFSGCAHLHVFSSGAGYDPIERWQNEHTVWCVRGPLTAKLLGVTADLAVTDGAILAPALFGPAAGDASGRAIGVVPHWESLHFPGWNAACAAAGMRLISPVDTPANVHAAIGAMSLVLTESLHGAILADAMGVPWIPIASTGNVSALKWVDWCLSVGVSFAPMPIAPPSVAAALAFGRPMGGQTGRVVLDAEAALAAFRGRMMGSLHAPQTLRHRAKSVLRAVAGRRASASRMLGFSPARTAAALALAAGLAPSLSRDTWRSLLRERMQEKLLAFERAQFSRGW